MLVVFNIEHGPWADDYRWNQMCKSWSEATRFFSPEELPLFEEYMSMMVAENRGRAALLAQTGGQEGDLHKLLWAKLRVWWSLKGYMTNLNRFFATRQKAASFIPAWTATRLKYEYLGLETGSVATRQIAKLKLKPEPKADTGDPDDQPRATTSATKPAIEERALRGSAQNAVVLATIMLGEEKHKMLVKAAVSASEPLQKWHSNQNVTLRNAGDGKKWMVEQLSGGFMAMVNDTINQMSTTSALEYVGFDLSAWGGMVANPSGFDPAVDTEGEIANAYGQLCIIIGARRMMRCMNFIRGWPLRFASLMGDENLQTEAVTEFRLDSEAFHALCNLPEKDAAIKDLESRSVSQDLSVRQYLEVALIVTKLASPPLVSRCDF